MGVVLRHGETKMMTPRKLSAVVLRVRDVDRALARYREKSGFEKLYDDAPNSKAVIVGTKGGRLALKPLEDRESATTVDTRHQACVGLFCLEVEESDLSRAAGEFAEDGDIVEVDDHPKYRSRIVEDRDGHAIELIVWKPDFRTSGCT